MADWKTYAKAARNTARKQAPGVKRSTQDSARRGSERAGEYVRAAGRAVEEARREDRPRSGDEQPTEGAPRPESGRRSDGEGRREYDPRPERAPGPEPRTERSDRSSQDRRPQQDRRPDQDRRPQQDRRPEQDRRPAVDTDRLRRGAAAYYTVAERRVRGAQLGPRIMRAVRDALLIGLSLFAIWVVLAAAGLQIPFSAVLIAVGVIVLISFGTSLYASSKRARDRAAADETDTPEAAD